MKNLPEKFKHSVDVILRDGAKSTHYAGSGNLVVPVSKDSIVLIKASGKSVLRYARHGDDLLIYMEDGTVIECTGYFSSPDNRLAFESPSQGFEVVSFDPATEFVAGEPMTLSVDIDSISSLQPLFEISKTTLDAAWLWGGLGILAGGVAAAAAGGGGGGGHNNSHGGTADNGGGSDNGGNSDNGGDSGSNAWVIALNPLMNNGLINADGATQPLEISGTSNFAAGASVVVTVNGKDYYCVTGEGGDWCVTLPMNDVAALADNLYTVTVKASDPQHNEAIAQTAASIVVDTCLPIILFNPIGDNILNAAEQQQDQVLSGTVANARPGDILTLTLNGHSWQAVINADMSWHVTLPGDDLALLADGAQTFSASVENYCGNCGEASGHFSVDTQAPSVTINSVTADNVINKTESDRPQVISGATTGAAEGDTVTVTLGGRTYVAVVDVAGNWQVGISANEMQQLQEGVITLTAEVKDAAGNSRTATHDFLVDVTGPTLTLDPVSNDNVIDALEKQHSLTLSGQCEPGTDHVTVIIGGKAYSALVDGATWSVALSEMQVAALPTGELTIVVSASDSVDNTTTIQRSIHVDGTDAPAISINTFATDNYLNAPEAGVDQPVTGRVLNAQPGDSITLTLGGMTYTTTVNADMTWRVTVPATDLAKLSEGAQTIAVEITSSSHATAQKTLAITVDTVAPTLTINAITADNVLNAAEHDVAQIVSGSATGVAVGAMVTFTLNGKTYTAAVNSSGNWSVGVPAADVKALAEGSITLKAEVADVAGNKATTSQDFSIDLTGTTLTLDNVTADNIVNAAEKGADLTLTGTCGNDAVSVNVTLNGKVYTAAVADGKWRLTVPKADVMGLPEGTLSIHAEAADAAGNVTSINGAFTVDTQLPVITINTITADNILNAAEHNAAQTISGTAGGVAEGTIVTLTLNGKDYTATVSGGTWSVTVPATDVAKLAEGGNSLSVTATDAAGNSASASKDFTVDTIKPGVTIDAITPDNVLNKTEQASAQLITGAVTGVAAGTTVTVILNDKTYTAVTDANGKWSVGVPAADLAALKEGTATVNVTVSDAAGNKTEGTKDFLVDVTPPTLTIGKIAGDDVVNAAEKGGKLVISGECDQNGATLVVTVNGKNYPAIVADGKWRLELPAGDVALLPEGAVSVTAVVTDAHGNSATVAHDITVDTVRPTVLINTFGGDNIIDAAEIAKPQILSGKVTGAQSGDTVTIHVGLKDYTAIVSDDLSWRVEISSADLKALGEGLSTMTAEVTNSHGNSGTGERDIVINAGLPGIHINTVTGDDVINTIEHAHDVRIAGSCTGLETGTVITVTLNGKVYKTAVTAGGLWETTIPAADVANWDGTETVIATATTADDLTISDKHDFTVDLSQVAISIDPVTADNAINQAEKSTSVVISGATTGVEEGQFVTVKFAGKSYQAGVDADGHWRLTVSADDMAALESGIEGISVSVSNAAGESAISARVILVVLDTPVISITSLAGGDGIINIAEHNGPLVVSGFTNVHAGCDIAITLNGKSYHTTAQSDGTWTLTIPADDVNALEVKNDHYDITATATDRYGNPGTATDKVSFDNTAPQVTIDNVTDDNVINATEHTHNQTIGGSSKDASEGDPVKVEMTVKGATHTWTTAVDAEGNWSISVPASLISQLSDGEHAFSVTITDAAGNAATASKSFDVITTLPSVTIGTVADDDLLNAAELGQPLAISGTSDADNGAQVIVTLGSKTYLATVTDGAWSLTVPASDLSLLADGDYTLTAQVVDQYLNHDSATHEISVDAKVPVITLDVFAGDNCVNHAESLAKQTISGQVTNVEAGEFLTVHLNDKEYQAEVKDVDGKLTWSVTIPAGDMEALTKDQYTLSVDVTTPSGNHAEASTVITVDTQVPVITFDPIAPYLNARDITHDLTFSGSVTGAEEGDVITVTFPATDGKTYKTVIDSEGQWRVTVPASELALLPEGEAIGGPKAAVTDKAGNSATGKGNDFIIDTTAPSGVTIDVISSDDVVNLAEKAQDLALTGTCPDDTVNITLVINGKTYTADITAGATTWKITVPASDVSALPDGELTVSATATDKAGNTADTTRSIIVDFTKPVITINVLGDDVLNAAEIQTEQTLSGKAQGAAQGDTVTVTLNGKTYTTTVNADLSWSVKVSADDIALITGDSVEITAVVTDKHGNKSDTATRTVTVDVNAPVVTIDDVATDNVINRTEHNAAQIISGKATGAEAGALVTVTLNGKSYTTTLKADGTWSVGVKAEDISALEAGNTTLKAEVSDKAGNTGSATHAITVDITGPALKIDPVSGDDVVNAAEKGQALIITGTCDREGATVTVAFNGKEYTAIVAEGKWSLTISAEEVALLPQGKIILIAGVNDEYGNVSLDTHPITIDTATPTVSIDTFCTDNVVDADEIAKAQTLSGKVTHASAGDTVTIHIGAHDYTAKVQADLSWSVEISAGDLHSLGNGLTTITAEVTNTHGNTGKGSHDILINADLPAIHINTVTGDDVINAIEHTYDVRIAGSCSGFDIGTTLTVTVNGKDYQTTVGAGGLWHVIVPAAEVTLWTGTEIITATATRGDDETVSQSRSFTVDLSGVAITIDPLTEDNVINTVEQQSSVVIHGSTLGIEAGQFVTITFAGKTFSATVGADGTWSLPLNAVDMAALESGVEQIHASVSNKAGEECATNRSALIALDIPTVHITSLAGGDGVINIAEHTAPMVVNGTTSVTPGCDIAVTINGKTWHTTALAGGTWTLTIPADDVKALEINDDGYSVTVIATDRYGNPGSTVETLTFDNTAPTVTIDDIAHDNVINATEHKENQIVSGGSSNAVEGDVVTLEITVEGTKHSYTALVDAQGKWSFSLPASLISQLPEGENTLSVTITDTAGNSIASQKTFTVDTVAPTVAIDDNIAGDDIINAQEAGKPLTISGTTDAEDGAHVVVHLGAKDYIGTVADGKWSVVVSASDLKMLENGDYTVTAQVVDHHLNTHSATHDISVDALAPTITFDGFATDNKLNAAETASDQTLTGSVTHLQPGDEISITVGDKTYDHVVITEDYTWSLTLPAQDLQALEDGTVTIKAEVITEPAGNSAQATIDVMVDKMVPVVTIDEIAVDNIINIQEHAQKLAISGAVTGADAGDIVTLTLGNKTYTTVVDNNGKWRIGIDADDVAALKEGSVAVSVSVTDKVGNKGTGQASVTVDTTAPDISIDAISDGVINVSEKGSSLAISGTCAADTETVKVVLNGETYDAVVTVTDGIGNWTLTLPADAVTVLPSGVVTVVAIATDKAGNQAENSRDVTVDFIQPGVTVETIATDNRLNGSEVKADLTITGKVTGAKAGDIIKVQLNGVNYTATVEEGLTWKVTVPAKDMWDAAAGTLLIPEGEIPVLVTVETRTGNTGNTSAKVTVDIKAPTVTINPVSGDNVFNHDEHGVAQIITGSAIGAPAGSLVTVTLNGHTYTGTTDAKGNWSIGVLADDVKALEDGSNYPIVAQVADPAGNIGSATLTISVDLTAPTLSINKTAADDVVNIAEKAGILTLSGASDENDATVTVTLNGKTYTATVKDGAWSLTVPAADAALLPEGSNTLVAEVTDTHGNKASQTHTFTVDTVLPTITFDRFCDDNIVDDDEIREAQTLSGTVTGAKAGDKVTVHVGVHDYEAIVQADLTWHIEISASDLKELGRGLNTLTAEVTNSHGNTGTGEHDISVQATIPGIYVGPVAGDDIVNAIEHGRDLTIAGTCIGLDAGTAITLTVNSKTYETVVLEGGVWKITVPAADVSTWPEGAMSLTVSATNSDDETVSGKHDFSVELGRMAITVDAVASDFAINAAEKASSVVISGTTVGVEAGQLVTVTIGDTTVQVAVGADGKWSVTLTAAEMAAFENGIILVTAEVTNSEGESRSASSAALVALDTPLVKITSMAGGDNIINIAEKEQDLVIAGTTSVSEGCAITVKLNGVTYSTKAKADGTWSVTVPASTVKWLPEEALTVDVTATDRYGNKGTGTGTLTYDTVAPKAIFDAVTGDDVINAEEHDHIQLISGTTQNAVEGDTVTLKIGDKTYTVDVDADGTWTFGIPASVIKSLPEGENTLSVTITDKAGNSSTTSHTINVHTTLPSIAINTVAKDDILNAAEKGQPLIVNGTSDAPDGAKVTLTFGTKEYIATVTGGKWSVTVPAADLNALGDGGYTLTAQITDSYGNANSTTRSITVDTQIPRITFNAFAGDNVVNATESKATQTLSGEATHVKAGDTVTIQFGSKTYTTTIKADGKSWSMDISAADVQSPGDGDTTITAAITTQSGNKGEGSLPITVDAGLPKLTIGLVAGDDVINTAEHGSPIVIQGASQNVQAGATVTVTINGVSHDAVVKADGSWQVGFSAEEVSDWPAGTLDIEATVNNAAGNETVVVKPVEVNLDGPAIAINAIAVDNIINSQEKAGQLTLSGSTVGVEENCTVLIKFGGRNYTTKVDADGKWKIDVSASDMAQLTDGQMTVQAIVINKAGNRADSSQTVVVDTKAPNLTVDAIAGDNVINAAEHDGAVTLTGKTDAGTGKTVTVKIGDKTFTGTVADAGVWSVTLPKESVSALTDGVKDVVVSVSDDAGNTTSKTVKVTVDTTLPTLTFDAGQLGGDDVINAAEHAQAQVISGRSTGLEEGATVTIKLLDANGTVKKTFVTSVDEDGAWSIGISATTVKALADGSYTLTADATDASGNAAAQAKHDIDVITAAPEISVTSTSAGSDWVINAAEKQADLVINGESDLPDDSALTLAFNGKTYSVTVTDGKWSLTIPADDLATLTDGSWNLVVQGHDASGNTSTTRKTIVVDTAAPVALVNSFTADNIINAAESASAQTLSGKVVNGSAGDAITVKLGDKTYTALVQTDMTWSVSVPGADLAALSNGKNTVTVTVTDNHGNSSNTTHDFGIAIKQPVVTIEAQVAEDDVINKIEHEQPLIIAGSATNLSVGDLVTVVISDGATSKTYTGTVQADGKTWLVVVPKEDVITWANDATMTITATGTDAYGNTSAAATHDITVNLSQVAVSLDPVATDDVINKAEAGEGFTLTGTTYNAADGSTVTVTFAGKTFTASVSNPAGAYGTWSVELSADDLAGLTAGNSNEIVVSVDGGAGNTAEESRFISYDPTPPAILIGVMAGDNVITASEMSTPLTINGTASQDAAGQTLTVTLNDKTYTTRVKDDGTWTVTVGVDDLADLTNGKYDVKAEVNDAAGNHGVVDPVPQLEVKIKLPKVVIDPITGDNFINAAEHNSSENLVITGTSEDASVGAAVKVVFNGTTYTGTVKEDGSWSITVNASVIKNLADGEVLVDASIDDGYGNKGYADQVKVIVDTVAPSVTITTPIAGDNVINNDERAAADGLTVSGTASPSEAGRTVTVTVTGTGYSQTYTATVGSDGKWSITLPKGDMVDMSSGSYSISASVKDQAGNEGTATKSITVNDTLPVVTIDKFASDDIVNKSEQGKSQIISGTTDAPAGKTVTVVLGAGTDYAKTYTATVTSDGKWSVTVSAADLALFPDDKYTIAAQVDNAIGNHGSTTRPVEIDTTTPTITFADNVAGNDNIVNIDEQTHGIRVSGTTTAEEGQTVTLIFNNGSTYSGKVAADGSWHIDLPGDEFTTLADGDYTMTAVVSDKAGNTSDVASKTIVVSDAKPAITIDAFTGDNWLNKAEAGATQPITGTCDLADGATVTVKLNDKTYTATVKDGKWRCDVAAADLAALKDGTSYDITASAVNAAGNTGSATQSVMVDISAPVQTITIDSISDDTGLSANDFITSDKTLTINGSLDAALGANEKAQISIDGGVTWIDLTVTDKTWKYTDARSLEDGTHIWQVRVIDKAGNIGNGATQDVVVDTVKPVDTKTVTIASIDTDSGLSGSDFITNDTTVTVHGKISAELAAGEHVQISLDNGASWTLVDVTGTDWRVDCGTHTETFGIKVRIIDDAGNIGSTASKVVTVDTSISDATIAITSISDDTGKAGDFKTKDTSLTINGTISKPLASDEIAQIRLDGGAWVTLELSGTTWSYANAASLTDGKHTCEVRIIDTAGNIGGTGKQEIVVDTAVSAVTITVTSIDSDTGLDAHDFITSDTSLTLHGTLSAELASDEWLEISLDGSTWTKLAVDGTDWSYTDARELNGDVTYKFRIADDAGNTSATTSKTVTVDTTAPDAQAMIATYTDNTGSRTGNFGSDTYSDEKSPTLNGTLSKALATGERVRVLRDGVFVGYATPGEGGLTWTFKDNLTSLTDGTYRYTAQIIDAAGNLSGLSDTFIFKLDTTIPDISAPVINVSTADQTPIVHGTIEGDFLESYYLEVTVNGKTYSSANGTVVIDIPNKTWYLQIPDSDILSANIEYTISTQVKTQSGNGNEALTERGYLDVINEPKYRGLDSLGEEDEFKGMAYTLNANGTWVLAADARMVTYTTPTANSRTSISADYGKYVTGAFLDYNRDGFADYLYQSSSESGIFSNIQFYYGTGTSSGGFSFNSASSSQNKSYYGAVVIFDRQGDGYLDAWLGDAGGNSNNWVYNKNGTLTPSNTGSGSTRSRSSGSAVTDFTGGMEGSAVDLNNDGKVDLALHTGNGNDYSFSTMLSKGDGSFTWLQEMQKFFYTDVNGKDVEQGTFDSARHRGSSLTWADFNGDGYMDLFTPVNYENSSTGHHQGRLYVNDKTGSLTLSVDNLDSSGFVGLYSLAIDWDHNGSMDIIKTGLNTGSSTVAYLNNGSGTAFTRTTIGMSSYGLTSGIAALDFDWDGATDVMVSYVDGSVQLIKNSNKVEEGTSLHFRILDKNGINTFFANTVNLYDSAGNRVATQMINPQEGFGFNDASALVSFYGLNANETYRVELLYQENGTSKTMSFSQNAGWGEFRAGAATDSYVLSVEDATATNGGTFVGTGYNDVFIATKGTDIYDGAGGWDYTSQHGAWSQTAGMDIIDFKVSGVGVTVDLSNTGSQNTGFNTVTLKNIEGVAGSNLVDTIKGSSGDNVIEGRGGNDMINISSGGHDTLLFKLLNSSSADGGVGHDSVTGFKVGTWEGTANTSRVDIHELLHASGYTGTGSAHYINNVATLDSTTGDIDKFVKVVVNGANTDIQIDRDGAGGAYGFTTVVTLNNVNTDLQTLLANHQLIVI